MVYWSSVQPGNFAFACARLHAMPAIPISMFTAGLKTELAQSLVVGLVSRSTWPLASTPRLVAEHPGGTLDGSHQGPVCIAPRHPHSVPLQPRFGQHPELPVQPTAL